MLPILMYNTMESGSNSANNSFSSSVNIYNDHVAVNGLRSRKKTTDLQTCPVCSCTIRNGELESHFSLEMERLQKLSSSGTKRKLSSSGNLAVPGSSTSSDYQEDAYEEEDIDLHGGTGSDVFQRVHTNRLQRLRARRRSTPPPSQGECPVCNVTYPTSRLQRHALRCLKRTGAQLDEDVPDFSSEDESIDVENDEPLNTGFGAEYEWCGQTRVRATALLDVEARQGTCVRRASNDTALVVDDDDTELYGPPQFSPSRIDSCDEPTQSNGENQSPDCADDNDHVTNEHEDIVEPRLSSEKDNNIIASKSNGLVEASAETRIQALKARIKELENKQNSGTEVKCLICLGSYTSPVVSIQCWHVYCEVCWLESLRAKKFCPQCNLITTTQHLRRIYM